MALQSAYHKVWFRVWPVTCVFLAAFFSFAVFADEPLFEAKFSKRELLMELENYLGPPSFRLMESYDNTVLAVLYDDETPAQGLRVTYVREGSTAEKWGVEKDEVIVSVDGEPVTLHDRNTVFPDLERESNLRIWNCDTGRRELKIPAGSLGVKVTPTINYVIWYWKHGNRNQRWDRVMIMGMCWAEVGEWDWADTAFAAALKAGYPKDELMYAMAFHSRYYHGDWALAGKMLEREEFRDLSNDEPWQPKAGLRLMTARAGGLGFEAVDIVRSRPNLFRDLDVESFVFWQALHRAAGDLDRDPDAPDPATIASTLERRPLLQQCEPGERWTFGGMSQSLNDEVWLGEPFTTSPKPGSYRQAFLYSPEPIGDFGVRMELQCLPNGKMNPKFYNAVNLNIVNYDEPGMDGKDHGYWKGRSTILGTGIRHHTNDYYYLDVRGYSQIGRLGLPARWLGWGWDKRHVIEFYRVGNHGQILINGRTYYNLPVDGEVQNLALHLHIVGIKTKIHSLEWFELEPSED
ncbi:hypothetical protein [Algisphaera agarilytica]|uniref:PDZ domain-containing protein n=1 Tax=Algisphaera agarilytica TaxID=1385975 RepID=A0A7X0H7Q7_9BACT|nr:hypothetical protein [Algisphaera agarilytica]MBB6430835.1 hypothetical protein [Algisphaera agarilytica]